VRTICASPAYVNPACPGMCQRYTKEITENMEMLGACPAKLLVTLTTPIRRRIVFETGRMAPILFHGLSQLGLPVVCVESRQAYKALKSLATHKTDRNDTPGLAYLARTGLFKPVHLKSLSAHALRSLIITRKKTGRPASDLGESDPRFGGRVREQSVNFSRSLCANTGHSSRTRRTGQFNPLLTFEIGPMNGRKAQESALTLKA
jgi:hypothetical protein